MPCRRCARAAVRVSSVLPLMSVEAYSIVVVPSAVTRTGPAYVATTLSNTTSVRIRPEVSSRTLSVTSTGPLTQVAGASSEVTGATSSMLTVFDFVGSMLPLMSIAAYLIVVTPCAAITSGVV